MKVSDICILRVLIGRVGINPVVFLWDCFFWFLQVPSEQSQEAIMDRLSAIERKIDRHEQ